MHDSWGGVDQRGVAVLADSLCIVFSLHLPYCHLAARRVSFVFRGGSGGRAGRAEVKRETDNEKQRNEQKLNKKQTDKQQLGERKLNEKLLDEQKPKGKQLGEQQKDGHKGGQEV